MRKNNGFTLIELLAVIVILAVIALTTIPLIASVIDMIRKAAYEESLKNIFNITEIYIATNGYDTFPEEGINVNDTKIALKNKDFTSGKIIKNEQGKLELDQVSNGQYCGSGTYDNLIVVEGSCDSTDITPPEVSITSNSVTSSSITIVATAYDSESGISSYQFSNDNGITWTSKRASNVYTFSGLTSDTEYTFKARAYNNNELMSTSDELVVATTSTSAPTYSVNVTGWSQSKIVTIHYPGREAGNVYEYSLDNALTWQEVASPAITKDITFNANGSVIARVSNGVNVVTGVNYQVTNIDTVAPIITIDQAAITLPIGSTYQDSGVTASDDMLGDISSDIEVTGSVNTNVVGTYTLTYNVSDLAGNAAETKTRTVEIIQQAPAMPGTFTYPTGDINKGQSITVSWGSTSSWGIPDTSPNYRLEVQYDGGSWTLVGNTGTTASIGHTVSSSASTLRYRVRAESNGGASDWQYSNTVNLISPILTMSVNIPSSGDSSSRSQSRTITISNLQSIESVSVNTGSVSYSVSGNNLTLNVSSGSVVRTYTPSYGASRTIGPQTSTSFPYSVSYNSGGYSGTLYKDGGYYYSGSSTEYQTFNWNRYMVHDEYHVYTSSGWVFSHSVQTGNPGASFYVSNGSNSTWDCYLGGNWSGTMYSTGPSQIISGSQIYYTFPSSPYIGQTFHRYRDGRYVYYSGTLSQSTSTYSQDYYGTVYGSSTSYYAYVVTVNYRTN